MKIIQELEKIFIDHKNNDIARKQESYMRHSFPFLGIPKPKQIALQKLIFSKFVPENEEDLLLITKNLWNKSEREYQYAALDFLHLYNGFLTKQAFSHIESLIREKSWWDTVDMIAAKILGPHLRKYPSLLLQMDNWIQDPNLWIRRSCLLFQLKWKLRTDENRLFDYCEEQKNEKDFFIQKAIGRALREYSKYNSSSVHWFLIRNKQNLSDKTLKEARKYLTSH